MISTGLLILTVLLLGALMVMQLRRGASGGTDSGEMARIQGLYDAANQRVRDLETALTAAQNAQRESDMALARAQ